jgi:polyphosphate glucokinase
MKLKMILGIDIGGSGVKGAIVNTKKGELVTERYRIPTPQPATPEAVAEVIKKITDHFSWEGPVGVGFPGVIQQGIARTAANVDDSWLDKDLNRLFSDTTGCVVHVVNDADAAGMAEVKVRGGERQEGHDPAGDRGDRPGYRDLQQRAAGPEPGDGTHHPPRGRR